MAEASRFFMDLADDISILWEETSYLVVNKPTGLLSQSTFGVDSVLFRLRALLAKRELGPGEPFVELPHRLDRGTSGLLLAAKSKTALKCFCEQFHARKTQKSYLVAVEGRPVEPRGQWIDWMRKIPEVAKAELAPPTDPLARQAILEYEEIYADERTSIHRVSLETGRMHQIRLQFAVRGFPVLGDHAYGGTVRWGSTLRHDHEEHFGLHAWKLSFRHPKDGRTLRMNAPLPRAWSQHFPNFAPPPSE